MVVLALVASYARCVHGAPYDLYVRARFCSNLESSTSFDTFSTADPFLRIRISVNGVSTGFGYTSGKDGTTSPFWDEWFLMTTLAVGSSAQVGFTLYDDDSSSGCCPSSSFDLMGSEVTVFSNATIYATAGSFHERSWTVSPSGGTCTATVFWEVPATISPTSQPTPSPTPVPTPGPTLQPTWDPTPAPTPDPTPDPTADPTPDPTPSPTVAPGQPTQTPTSSPTATPTATPTHSPTATPTLSPTGTPTQTPTATPSAQPTSAPVVPPTMLPPNVTVSPISPGQSIRDELKSLYYLVFPLCEEGCCCISPSSITVEVVEAGINMSGFRHDNDSNCDPYFLSDQGSLFFNTRNMSGLTIYKGPSADIQLLLTPAALTLSFGIDGNGTCTTQLVEQTSQEERSEGNDESADTTFLLYCAAVVTGVLVVTICWLSCCSKWLCGLCLAKKYTHVRDADAAAEAEADAAAGSTVAGKEDGDLQDDASGR